MDRVFDCLLARGLSREGDDSSLPSQAIVALQSGIGTLKTSPFIFRKAGQRPFVRELIAPIGRSDHAALFDIEDEANVVVLTVHRQVDDDPH